MNDLTPDLDFLPALRASEDVEPPATHFVDTAAEPEARNDPQGLTPDAGPISGIRTLPDAGIDLRAAVEEFESNLIRQALVKTGGNKNKAAQLLKLNRTTLVEMVKRKRLYVA